MAPKTTQRARGRARTARRRSPRRRRRGARRRASLGRARGLLWIGTAVLAVAVPSLLASCATPPRQPDDLCSIFFEKRSWYRAAKRARERWGVPESVQLAIIHQESSFRARARPPRSRILWIFPGPRPSSAYGYGQVIDATWDRYRRDTGRAGADRDDFADVADFIGWYAVKIERRAGVPRNDAYRLYLAYHEGPRGYVLGNHRSKAWLDRVARKVRRRANRYHQQYMGCRERLQSPWWWPF
ncbi:MAG: transglycosylase SLT domain-containing protein [Myxococcota bacterium]